MHQTNFVCLCGLVTMFNMIEKKTSLMVHETFLWMITAQESLLLGCFCTCKTKNSAKTVVAVHDAGTAAH